MEDSDSDCVTTGRMGGEESDFFDSSENEENVAPPKKLAVKKAVTKKVTTKQPKDLITSSIVSKASGSTGSGSGSGRRKSKEKTIEELYQKKSQIEHILIRPDTYVGSTQPLTVPMYILNEHDRIVEREITYTPGLFKIFDEIVVNAADNKQRDPNMDKLDITVDASANLVSVRNNGKGIPIVMHKEHDVYVPTMIFGQLLTGSNFDDNEAKTTGGRNGYGAKLANVFSTEFIVECADTERGLRFRQVFTSNMSVANEPIVKSLTAAEAKQGDFVKISFSPDLKRFKMDHLDASTVGLFSKRAYDIAGTMAHSGGKRLVVSLNGKKLPIKTFKDYMSVFDNVPAPVAFASSDRWEVGVGVSNDAVHQQISFVNAIHTSSGGKHVAYIADQVAAHLTKVLKKKNKGGTELKKAQIINHLFIMVNCLIENPSFDSQTKDKLNTQAKSFGSEFKLSPEFLKKVEKSDIAEKILSYATFKDKEALKRKGGVKKVKLTGIAKLDDANMAGGARSIQCTLIITEGDSAKSLAMAGLSVVGRDFYGVFPLKGKPMNVRDAASTAVGKNEEIQNLVDIMGLKYGTVYDNSNIKTLRYGHLMIMADQDSDGSHIKGLIINLIHKFWPSLLDVSGFLQQFITPIVKVSKGKKARQFFTLPEYESWLESTGNNGKGFTIKYYKGLGTSTSAEAKEYFSNLDLHEVQFDLLSNDVICNEEENAQILPDNVASGSDLIDMVFRKDRVEDRKLWLSHVRKDIFLDFTCISANGLRYSDFINKEYILFSNYDNDRSIPHVMDGFKPSQRKVLFGCFKRKLYKNEIKVAQLVGYVAEHSSYHHGEASLQGTIVTMAQNFVGSNNINLLTPSGQFGTRRMGGNDAASPRYIFTKLEPIARTIFHPDDDELLNYLNDDGSSIEPEFYVPVIPLALCNGAEGIGTGWSSKICNYSPREIIANLRRKIQGEEMVPMAPFFCGFTGRIEEDKKGGKFVTYGKIDRVDDTTLSITELPIKKWTQTFKEFLEVMLVGDSKAPPELKDMKENHTETTVSFTISAAKEKIDEWEKEPKGGLYVKFKLTSSLSTSNMTLFDRDSRITRYDTPEDIIDAFYHVRLEFYIKRKENLVRNLEAEKLMLSNKARFIEEVCSGELIVSNRKRVDILEELRERGFDLISKCNNSASKTGVLEDENTSDDEDDDEDTSTGSLAKGYEYLLGMKIWSLTFEKAQQLRAELEKKSTELEELQATEPTTIWERDLVAVEVALDERDAALFAAEVDERKAQKKNKVRVAKKKKKSDEWDSSMESDDEMSINGSDDDVFSTYQKPKVTKPRAMAGVREVLTVARKAAPVVRKVGVLEVLPVARNKVAPTVHKVAPKIVQPAASDVVKSCASVESIDSDDELDFGTSLLDRMQKKLTISQPATTSTVRVEVKKRPSPRMDEIVVLESDDEIKPRPMKAAKKPLVKTKLPPAKKKVVAKKTVDLSDDDDDSEDEFDFPSKEEVALPAARARTARGAASKKVAKYAFDSDSDEENSDDDESE